MFLKYLITVLFFNFINGDLLNSFVEVKTKNGIVRGEKKVTLFEQKEFNSFRGIPYAKPPLNHLRFLPPQQLDTWEGVLDTLNYKSECTQIKGGHTEISGEEDCLYLNVFVPAIKSEEKLPVMLFAYGGGFYEGSGDGTLHGPDFLVEKDVILVTFNYRLSIFGFLSLNDDLYSGNMALKDYLMALKWVNENIESFNGDPNRITIFGHSAGSAMTHLLAISPVSKGLFQRAIMLSATAVLGFSSNDEGHRDAMFDLARKEQQTSDNFESLVKFLQTHDTHKLFYGSQFNFPVNPGRREIKLYWAPIIESNQSIAPIITDYPENMFATQGIYKYDAMFGLAAHEMLFAVSAEAKNSAYLEPFDEQFEINLPHKDFKLDFESDEYKEIAEEIREFYFGVDGSVNNDTFYEYIDLLTDALFAYDIDRIVKKNAAQSIGATYYFRFSIDAKLNVLKHLKGMTEWSGTSHGDELCYAFKCAVYTDEIYHSFDQNSIERQTIDRVTTLWTNFAKYGNPTPNNIPTKWKPVTTKQHNFLDIGNEGLSLAQNPNYKYIQFWDDLFEKYKHYAKISASKNTNNSDDEVDHKNDEL